MADGIASADPTGTGGGSPGETRSTGAQSTGGQPGGTSPTGAHQARPVSGDRLTEISALGTDRGRTSIADSVVAKVAGLAAREVPGVHSLGGGAFRAFAAMRKAVPGGRPDVARGVAVEVGTKQAAVEIGLIVHYGVPIAEVAQEVRENVIAAVERMTGLEVVEVDISVDDIHLDQDEQDEQTRRLE